MTLWELNSSWSNWTFFINVTDFYPDPINETIVHTNTTSWAQSFNYSFDWNSTSATYFEYNLTDYYNDSYSISSTSATIGTTSATSTTTTNQNTDNDVSTTNWAQSFNFSWFNFSWFNTTFFDNYYNISDTFIDYNDSFSTTSTQTSLTTTVVTQTQTQVPNKTLPANATTTQQATDTITTAIPTLPTATNVTVINQGVKFSSTVSALKIYIEMGGVFLLKL